jgi:23S rRNA pseudouridine1911/1915/1917 synthase
MDNISLTRQVADEHAGLRLDQAAVLLFPGFSRARLQSWIRDGSLVLDGKPSVPKHKVIGGEILELEAKPDPEGEVTPQDIPLDIIAADEHVIVLNKPAGLVVHPAAGHPCGTLQNGLIFYDAGLAAIPRSGIVHRLDKDTSGVMVVARSLKAHASLVAQLQDRSMSRVYQAVLHGITRASGTVNAPVGRNPRDRQRMAVVAGGRPAVSHYRLLNAFRHFSHVRVSLESGRTHQIRVHMQHLGHPLVGDPQYGRKTPGSGQIPEAAIAAISAFPRQALHACKLRLVHPGLQRQVEFLAPVPDDLAGLLRTLELVDT